MSKRNLMVGAVAAALVLGVAPTVAVALPATTTVTGVVRYSTSDNQQHAARAIAVEIRDADGTTGGTLVGTTTTDDAGGFSLAVATKRADGHARRLLARALSRTTGLTVHAPGKTVPYVLASTPQTATGATQTVTMTIGNTTAAGTAFDVTDALVTGVRYGRRVAGQALPAVSVVFPDPTVTNSTNTLMRIRQTDQFDWDVILHEYGHAVAIDLGIDRSPGEVHFFGQNLAEPPRSKLNGLRLAWSEGFATYFSLTAQDILGVAALNIPGAGDAFYDDSGSPSVHVGIGTDVGIASAGEDDELSVARTLWHFRVDATTQVPDVTLVSTLRTSGATTLTAAVAALLPAAAQVAQRNGFDCVLTRQNVAPLVTAPIDGTTVSLTDPPTFTWVPHGAGPSHRLTKFVVKVFSPDWSKARFTSASLTGTSFTPTTAQWKNVIRTGDVGLHVVVQGSSADAPKTGPYSSCAIDVDQGGGLTATPLMSTFHPPALNSACGGLSLPQQSMFTLAGSALTPSATYDIVLHAPNGAAPDVTLTPVTTDSHGAIANSLEILKPMPSGGSWLVTAKPRHAGDLSASVPQAIGGFACVRGDPDTPRVVFWGGVGGIVGSTAVASANGQSLGSAVADGSSTYQNSDQVTCSGTMTVRISYFDIDGLQSLTLHGPCPT